MYNNAKFGKINGYIFLNSAFLCVLFKSSMLYANYTDSYFYCYVANIGGLSGVFHPI